MVKGRRIISSGLFVVMFGTGVALAQTPVQQPAQSISQTELAEMRYAHELTDSLPSHSQVLSVAIGCLQAGQYRQYENEDDELHSPALQILREATVNASLYFDIKYNVMGSRHNPHIVSFKLKVK
jgi:hypothetical protein